MARSLTGKPRTLLQATAVCVGLGLLAVPPVALVLSGADWSQALWSALRLAALEAFTLVFLDIVTGSFRPVFVRIYKGSVVQRTHFVTALTGFVLAVGHGLMAFVFGVSGYSDAVWIGPGVLVLLVGVIVTASRRRHLRRSWRWVHRLNYAIFAAVLAHGLLLGYDLSNQIFLKVWFAVYATVVAAGLVYRLVAQVHRVGRTA